MMCAYACKFSTKRMQRCSSLFQHEFNSIDYMKFKAARHFSNFLGTNKFLSYLLMIISVKTCHISTENHLRNYFPTNYVDSWVLFLSSLSLSKRNLNLLCELFFKVLQWKLFCSYYIGGSNIIQERSPVRTTISQRIL